MTITWRNVNAPPPTSSGNNVSTALGIFNSGLDRLTGSVQDLAGNRAAVQQAEMALRKQENTNAALNPLNAIKTIEEYERLKAEGGLPQLTQFDEQFGRQYDRAAVQSALQSKEQALRDQFLKNDTFNTTRNNLLDRDTINNFESRLAGLRPGTRSQNREAIAQLTADINGSEWANSQNKANFLNKLSGLEDSLTQRYQTNVTSTQSFDDTQTGRQLGTFINERIAAGDTEAQIRNALEKQNAPGHLIDAALTKLPGAFANREAPTAEQQELIAEVQDDVNKTYDPQQSAADAAYERGNKVLGLPDMAQYSEEDLTPKRASIANAKIIETAFSKFPTTGFGWDSKTSANGEEMRRYTKEAINNVKTQLKMGPDEELNPYALEAAFKNTADVDGLLTDNKHFNASAFEENLAYFQKKFGTLEETNQARQNLQKIYGAETSRIKNDRKTEAEQRIRFIKEEQNRGT